LVIWTPEEWEKELNEFAAAVRKKKFNKISYDDWRMMWSWRDLPSTTDIYLKINSDNDFMCSPYGKMDFVIFERKANCPFLDYLQSKYCAVLGYAESCTQWSITNLVPPHLTTNMTTNYTVNYAPSPYSAIATSDVISNSNLATTQSFKQEYDTIWQTMTATIDNKKEKKDMNFFKNFEFGPVKNDTVRLSPYGLAVKNLDNSWVSYDAASDSIIDVDVFNFEGKNLIYKIPTAPHTVRAGDMIVHQGKGMYVLTDVCEGDTCVSVIDPRAGESKEILFTKSPFGFTFVTKLVSLLDMSGINANTDNPFGNLWPLALMGDKDCDAATMMAFMMMNSEGCSFDMSNPMMMYALMSGDNKDMLLPMMLMADRK
jgi:hypothetical protein